ncbi:phage holin family protein [Vacuolonema iberomarrocanum]|uniref:phage holin family protein n=1 Tax=Vacuolonema iberomarrocanum TaxID=3454632 RepID=UPI0019EAC651|nr:phage holin family protein [filamentous cyanobacterium LEGE 07170]
MAAIIPFLITVLILTLSLLIISKLPLGVDIDSFGKALFSGLVLGLLNALIRPILGPIFGATVLNVLTLGLASLLLNALIFGLAAQLVRGFRLRWGIISALLGAFALSIVYGLLNRILITIGLVSVG